MLSVRCETGPSVPPAQLSWIVSQSARPLQSEETIHSTDQGSFFTVSRMNVTVPSGSRVEDIVVQCVATHLSLGEASLEAVHVIKVASSTSTVRETSQTTEQERGEVGVEETTGAIEHLDYYESYDSQEYQSNHLDFYAEADTDIDNKKPEETVDTTTDTGVDKTYNKYNVEVETKVEENIVLLQTESEEEEDAVMSAKHSAAAAAGGSLKQRQLDLEIPTKSEPTDKSSYSSQRDDTISMTETTQKTESAPIKGPAMPRVKSSSANIRYSIIFLVLPIFISQI